MKDNFKGIQHAPFEDDIVGVQHINNIEGYVLCAQVLRGAK
jgi:hypothetical protein